MPASGNGLRLYVEGLDEFRRAARAAGPRIAKRVQQANKAAAERVRDTAREQYASMYGQPSGRHKSAIRATATQAKAQVHLVESDRAGGLLGQEFGSHRFRQFPSHAGREGHFFYPAVRGEVPRLADDYLDSLADALSEVLD